MQSLLPRRRLLVLLLALALLAGGLQAWATPPVTADAPAPGGGPATYAYDGAGQLVGMVTDDGEVWTYSYDDAGNTTAVTPHGSPAVAVLSVVPERARAGEKVVVTGKGFSTTPAQNDVTVGGTTAVVSESNAHTISFTMPSASGAVAVVTPSGSATGQEATQISAVAPTITSFSPAAVREGDQITLTGSGFSSVPANNVVRLNGGYAGYVSSTGPTNLVVEVPDLVSSGPITITTPDGTATSSEGLRVVPSDLAMTNKLGPSQILLGTAATLTIPAGVTYLATFDTEADAAYSVTGSSAAGASNAYTVRMYDAANRRLPVTAQSQTNGNLWAEPNLITTGDLATLAVTNNTSATKDVTVTVDQIDDVFAGVLPMDATPIALATSTAGQSAFARFLGHAGQRVGLEVGVPVGGSGVLSITSKVDEDVVWSKSYSTSGGFVEPITIPAEANYRITWNPNATTSATSVVVKAWNVPADVDSGTIADDGTPTTIGPNTTPGQNSYVTFTAAAGDRISVSSGAATAGSGNLRLLRPDGTEQESWSRTTGANGFIEDVETLTANGVWKLVWDVTGAPISSTLDQVKLWRLPDDVNSGTLLTDGTAKTVGPNTTPGQNSYVTFTASAGDRVSVKSGPASAGSGKITILSPAGTEVDNWNRSTSAYGFIDSVKTLSAAGTYTLVWNPATTSISSISVQLWNVPDEVDSGSIVTDGTPKTIGPNTTPGQNSYVTFNAAAGDLLSAKTAAASAGSGTLTVIGPTGTVIDNWGRSTSTTSFIDEVKTLSTAGTYTLRWNPSIDTLSSIPAQLWTFSDVDAGAMPTDGSTKTFTISTPGQRSSAEFGAVAGTYTVTVSGSVTNGRVYVLNAAGSSLAYRTGNGTFTFSGTAGETFRVRFDPTGETVGSTTVALTSPSGSPRLSPIIASDPVAQPAVGGKDTSAATRPSASTAGKPVARRSRLMKAPLWVPSARNLAGHDWEIRTAVRPAAAPLRAGPGITALSGIVRDLDGRGVAGVVASGQGQTAITDKQGRFLLTGLTGGQFSMTLDGTKARFRDRAYGVFNVPVRLDSNRTTVMRKLWFPRLDTRHTVKITNPLPSDLTLTTPLIPGLKVKIPAGSVIRDRNGKEVNRLGITPLPTNRLPFDMPNQRTVPVYFTVQPGGSTIFPSGARVIYPNYTHVKPGARVDFVEYQPAGAGWDSYGTGHVSKDGRRIVPDKNAVVWSTNGFSIGIDFLLWPLLYWLKDFKDWLSGDPVQLSTGKITDSFTDLAIDDVVPIELTRATWQGDGLVREFGVNSRISYDWYMLDTVNHQELDLNLPDGGNVHFSKIPGSDYEFLATNAPPKFRGAIFDILHGSGYHLRLQSGETWFFPYDSRPAWMEDKNGNRVTFVRPSNNGNITRIVSPSGKWIKLTYNGQKLVTQARDVSGRTVSYTYDASKRLTSVTNPAGETRTYTYDGTSDRIASITDTRGTTYLQVSYDSAGRVESQDLPGGVHYEFDYVTNGAGAITQTSVTEPNGSVTTYDFDARGVPTSVTEAAGTGVEQVTSYARDATGEVQSITDPLGRRTDLTYDSLGRPTKTTALAGTANAKVVDQRAYGPYSLPTSTTDAAGEVTTYAYDEYGDLTSITDPLDRTTNYTVNSRGLTTSVSTPEEKVTETGYASDGSTPLSVTDPLGRETTIFRDVLGRPAVVKDAAGNRTTTAYDELNNPTDVTDPLGREYAYEYDANGNMTSFTDPRDNTTSWTYNGADQPTTVTDPLNDVTTLTYNSAGQLASQVERSGTKTTYDYDELGRVSTVNYGVTSSGEESSVAYEYDDGDRLTEVDDSAAGTTTYQYTPYDQIDTETTPNGVISTEYDDAGRPTDVTVDSGSPTTYAYDVAGQLTTQTHGSDTTTFAYSDDSQITGLTGPGGWKTITSYDDAGQITSNAYSHTPSGGSETGKGEITYAYTANGLREVVGGSLANASAPVARSGMTYDAANRLTGEGSTTFEYDDDGNLTEDATTTYAWNARGELVSTTTDGRTSTYIYGSDGARQSREIVGASDTTQTDWLYQGANAVQETIDKTGSSPTTATLLSAGIDGWLARQQGGTTDTVLTDALGSPVALGRSDGDLAARYAYDPYGNQVATGDTRDSDLSFTGRQLDATGLMYYRARYYSPALGRFISEDPIGITGGTNLYEYVNNSPTNLTDPSGNNPLIAGCVGGAATDAFISWGTQRLSGQKVNWNSVGKAAVAGCVAGMVGFGLGRFLGAKLAGKGVDDIGRLTASQRKSLRSLQDQVDAHRAKLDAFRRDPDAFDNLDFLKNAPTPEIRQRIIDGRIRHLETEIRAFQDQIDKLLGGG